MLYTQLLVLVSIFLRIYKKNCLNNKALHAGFIYLVFFVSFILRFICTKVPIGTHTY